MATPDDFLAHYGVKGMKWGVRRKKDSASSSTKKSRKPFITRDNAKTRALQLAGAAYVAKFAYNVGKTALPILLEGAITRRQAANGARFAAQMLADTRGLTNYKTIVL